MESELVKLDGFSALDKLLALTRLLRLRYAIYPAAGALSGAFVSQADGDAISLFILVKSVFIVEMLWLGGMVVNSIADLEMDRMAIKLARDKKYFVGAVYEERPLANGQVSLLTACIYAAAMYCLAMAGAYSVSLNAFLHVVFLAACSYLYNYRLKHMSLSGSLFFGLIMSQIFIVGGLIAGKLVGLHGYMALSTFFFHTGIHTFGCIKDYESDKSAANKTIAVDYGIRGAAIIGTALMSVGYAIASIPGIALNLNPRYLLPVAASAMLLLPHAARTISDPVPAMGWKTLSRSIICSTILYLSYITGVMR